MTNTEYLKALEQGIISAQNNYYMSAKDYENFTKAVKLINAIKETLDKLNNYGRLER